MRNFLVFVLINVTITCYGQKIVLDNRIDYFKSHKLFVVNVELNHKGMSNKLDSIIQIENVINKNIKKCLDNFWFLNDSIIYIRLDELKKFKKEYPEDIYLEFKNEYFYGYMLHIPKNTKLLNDISPRLLGDTSLISIIGDLRILQYNVIQGDIKYSNTNNRKIILILDEPTTSRNHQEFIDEFKRNFPNSFKIVDRFTLLDALYKKDSRYAYIDRLTIFNIEDGSIIPL